MVKNKDPETFWRGKHPLANEEDEGENEYISAQNNME